MIFLIRLIVFYARRRNRRRAVWRWGGAMEVAVRTRKCCARTSRSHILFGRATRIAATMSGPHVRVRVANDLPHARQSRRRNGAGAWVLS